MIVPLLHRILLKLDSIESTTESGIIIPKEIIKKERKAVEVATVIAIGPTCFKDYGGDITTVSVGDKVIIAKYSGKEITDTDNNEFVVVNDEDVICILKGEK